MTTTSTRWRPLLTWSVGAIALLLALPAAAVAVGDSLAAPLTTGDSEEIVEDWRAARLAYRVGRISPFFWTSIAEREDEVDRALSGVYLRQVVDGTIAEHSAHLNFLDNRSQDDAWRGPQLETMLRYGDAAGVLEDAWGVSEACEATAAAVSIGNRASLATWLPQCDSAPPVLWLLAELEHTESVGTDPLSVFITAESRRRSGDNEGARQLLSGLLDGELAPWAAQSLILTLSDPADLPEELTAAPTDDPRWMGAWLAAATKQAAAGLDDDAAASIERAVALDSTLPELVIAYRFLSAPFLPYPGFFEPALKLTQGETHARLRLLKARAALQGMDISTAQSALKPLRQMDVSDAIHAERLMLRSLSRELSGDIEGARKYADEGLPLDKARFKLISARLMLLAGEREEPMALLDNLGHYPLSEDMEAQRQEALQLARRLNGARSGFTLSGHSADADVFQEDDVFRLWYADYLAGAVASPSPTPSLAIPIMRYWRGANKHGDFLLNIRLDDGLSVHGELVRAHLGFLRGQVTDGDSSGWSSFSAARIWAMQEPFRFLLPHAVMPYREEVPR